MRRRGESLVKYDRSAGLDRRAVVALLRGAAIALVGCVTRPAQPVSLGQTRQDVTYVTREKPGTIVVDPDNHFLYLVQKGGQAVQYRRRQRRLWLVRDCDRSRQA